MQEENKGLWAGISAAGTIGFYLLSSVVVGLVFGRWIDTHFGSGPWATIVGIILGMIAGLWATYKKILEAK